MPRHHKHQYRESDKITINRQEEEIRILPKTSKLPIRHFSRSIHRGRNQCLLGDERRIEVDKVRCEIGGKFACQWISWSRYGATLSTRIGIPNNVGCVTKKSITGRCSWGGLGRTGYTISSMWLHHRTISYRCRVSTDIGIGDRKGSINCTKGWDGCNGRVRPMTEFFWKHNNNNLSSIIVCTISSYPFLQHFLFSVFRTTLFLSSWCCHFFGLWSSERRLSTTHASDRTVVSPFFKLENENVLDASIACVVDNRKKI